MPYCYRFEFSLQEIKAGNLIRLYLEFISLFRSLKNQRGVALLTGFDPDGELRDYKREHLYLEVQSELEPRLQQFVKKYGGVRCDPPYLADTRIIAGKI